MKNILYCCVLLLCICACQKDQKEKSNSKKERWIEFSMLYDDSSNLVKNIYVDRYKCLHVSKECEILDSIYQVNFVDTSNLVKDNFDFYCVKCVNRKRYEHLCAILNRNSIMKDSVIIAPWVSTK